MPRFFIDPDIAKAKTPHTDLYTDPVLFELMKEQLFAPSWQFVGDTDLVAGASNVYPFTLLENYIEEPLVLVRDEQGGVRILSNVCTHRGNLIASEACQAAHLRCR